MLKDFFLSAAGGYLCFFGSRVVILGDQRQTWRKLSAGR